MCVCVRVVKALLEVFLEYILHIASERGLQAHTHAAEVANVVRAGAARGVVHSDLCRRMGQTCMRVHAVCICSIVLQSTEWHKLQIISRKRAANCRARQREAICHLGHPVLHCQPVQCTCMCEPVADKRMSSYT